MELTRAALVITPHGGRVILAIDARVKANHALPPLCPRCDRTHSGTVDCEGNMIDWASRKSRAIAFLEDGRKPGQHWSEKHYDYSA